MQNDFTFLYIFVRFILSILRLELREIVLFCAFANTTFFNSPSILAFLAERMHKVGMIARLVDRCFFYGGGVG